jgi:acetyl-CoA carboxylase biotin carboxyl carrier protein
MDIRKVKKLIELLEESGIAEIEIKEGEESVRITSASVVAVAPPPIAPVAAPAVAVSAEPQSEPDTPVHDGHVVAAPMVGTFYDAPSPESDAFVRVGQVVSIGDPLCIIEAMKIMNPIEAERAGTITAVLAENGHPVEYEQPLFVID